MCADVHTVVILIECKQCQTQLADKASQSPCSIRQPHCNMKQKEKNREQGALKQLAGKQLKAETTLSRQCQKRACWSDDLAAHSWPSEDSAARRRPSDVSAAHCLSSDVSAERRRPSDVSAAHRRPSDSSSAHHRPSDVSKTAARCRPSDVSATHCQGLLAV